MVYCREFVKNETFVIDASTITEYKNAQYKSEKENQSINIPNPLGTPFNNDKIPFYPYF